MRWVSLPDFGDRIPLNSVTIEPAQRFLTKVPVNSWLGQQPGFRTPWAPSMGSVGQGRYSA